MSTKAYKNVGKRSKVANATQKTKLDGQVENSCGAFVFELDQWKMLDRFLVLGTEGGSYYASETKLTKSNVKNVGKLIKEDGVRVVNKVVEISDSGRAPKNDAALFVLAMASAEGDVDTRRAAFAALPKVARIGTHLFNFVAFREEFAGWGKSMRKAVSNWYNHKSVENVAFQLGKYQSRDGWSNRDLLRLAHANPGDDARRSTVYKWVVDSSSVDNDALADASPILHAYEEIKRTTDEKRIVSLINEHRLPLEMVPTDKRSRQVYEAMIDNFGITALIRNLGKMSSLGILDGSNFDEVNRVVSRITNVDAIQKGRVHPIGILLALTTYQSGHGVKGNLSWKVNGKVVDALDEAFYTSFKNIVPTDGQRILVALDVSGSMGSLIAGTSLSAKVASAAMSMAIARTEKNYHFVAFTSSGNNYWTKNTDENNVSGLMELSITGKMRLNEVVDTINGLSFGATDCSLPMRWAMKNNTKFDNFIVFTDNETNNFNTIQPATALKQYRNKTGIPAKLIVNGMTATGFTIADPNDSGMLDVVGLDANAPQIMSQFMRGEI